MHIYTHPEFLNHEVAEGHAERPERLSHLLAHLQREGILSDSPLRQPNDVSDAQILAAHSPEHLQFLRSSAPSEGVVPLDPDTWMSKASMNAARLAAGAVCNAVDDVLTTTENRVFCGAAWASRGNRIGHGLLFAQQYCHWRITRVAATGTSG